MSRTGPLAFRKNCRNTWSYGAMLSRRVTSVVRPAQYRSARSVGSRVLIAVAYASTAPEPTGRPAARSGAAKSASTRTNGKPGATGAPAAPASATGGDLFQVLQDQFQVVALLDHRTQGVLGGLRPEFGGA